MAPLGVQKGNLNNDDWYFLQILLTKEWHDIYILHQP